MTLSSRIKEWHTHFKGRYLRKPVLVVLSVLTLFLLFLGWALSDTLVQVQLNELRRQEKQLKPFLVEGIKVNLDGDSVHSLEEYLQDQVNRSSYLAYVVVYDAQGGEIASIIPAEFGDIKGVFGRDAPRSNATRMIDGTEGTLLDSTVVLPGGELFQFGFQTTHLPPILREVGLPILFSFALGLMVVLMVLLFLYKNHKELSKEGVFPGGEKGTGPHIGVEFEELGGLFNEMMESLDSDWQKSTEVYQKLKDREFMRSHFLNKVITAQEEERKRISRELHDHTSQSLSSIMLGLRAIQNAESLEEVQEYTVEFRELVSASLEEIQHLAFELRPSALDDLGLLPALTRYIQELSKRKGITIDFQAADYTACLLETAEETVVYRVVQEALTNVVKHAFAQKVKVRLKARQGSFVVLVKDDGIGFNSDIIKEHNPDTLGIFGMRERTKLAGGKHYIKSAPGKGTSILLVLPLKEGGRDEDGRKNTRFGC